jgi:curved DNA-binding protein CbpA
VLPGAEARKIKCEYEAKAALLEPGLISGAPPNVVTAVMRAQHLLDTARTVLGDPESRRHYDELAGLRRSGGGLGQHGTGIERDRRAAVPDVRGLFYRVCLEVATRHGLHVRIVRLTERPMAVDGLVVHQDPRPPSKASRGDTLTVQLWHPPARSRW